MVGEGRMELHALRLSVTEQDLNEILRRYVPKDAEVEELRIRLSAQGIHVTGVYSFFFPVRFETIWEVGVANGQASARLASFKAMGVPGNIFKSAVVKIIEDVAREESWIHIVGDCFYADIDLGCARYFVPAQFHLRAITVQPGSVLLEAGQ